MLIAGQVDCRWIGISFVRYSFSLIFIHFLCDCPCYLFNFFVIVLVIHFLCYCPCYLFIFFLIVFVMYLFSLLSTNFPYYLLVFLANLIQINRQHDTGKILIVTNRFKLNLEIIIKKNPYHVSLPLLFIHFLDIYPFS